MQREYTTLAGRVYNLYQSMLEQPHLLIAGATGSGKSVVINGMIATALYSSPAAVRLILVDVKRVELCDYKRLPHCIAYADDVKQSVKALEQALAITESRYKAMQRQRVKRFDGSDLYIFIDELADLMTTCKKDVTPLIQRLCQIGRAARVHVVAATQCPIVAVIPTQIKVNFDARVGLRTWSAQDSRNILGLTGCERLPRYGQGYYMTPEGLTLYKIPMIDDSQIDCLIAYWTSRKGKGKLSLF